MKILILIDNLGSGGMQAQLVNLINGLIQRSNDVHLVLYHPGHDENFFDNSINLPKVNITRLKSTGGFQLSVVMFILSESCHNDVVMSFLHSANFYVTCAKLLSAIIRPNRKFFNIAVDMSSFGNRHTRWLSLMSFISMCVANRVVTNSEAQRLYYRGLPGGKRKCVFIANGVDKGRFYVPPDDWAVGENDFLLVVGRVTRAKNGPAFVRAIGQLSREMGRPHRVVWVGRFDSDPMAQNDKNKMEDLITELVSQGHIEWTWAGEVEDVERFYSRASCLIIPSRWEGVPNVLVEAMLSGCPVVSTPVSDIPFILGKNERGVLCDGVESEDIAAGVKTFVELQPKELDDMRRRAQLFSMREFATEKMVDKYVNVMSETD